MPAHAFIVVGYWPSAVRLRVVFRAPRADGHIAQLG